MKLGVKPRQAYPHGSSHGTSVFDVTDSHDHWLRLLCVLQHGFSCTLQLLLKHKIRVPIQTVFLEMNAPTRRESYHSTSPSNAAPQRRRSRQQDHLVGFSQSAPYAIVHTAGDESTGSSRISTGSGLESTSQSEQGDSVANSTFLWTGTLENPSPTGATSAYAPLATSTSPNSAPHKAAMELEEPLQQEGHLPRQVPWWFPWLPSLWRIPTIATSHRLGYYDNDDDEAEPSETSSRTNYDPLNASGCAIDLFARAPIFLTTVFLGPALLELARSQALQESSEAAGQVYTSICSQDAIQDENCWDESSARVYGLFKPSSLLTNIAIVAGLASTVAIPIVGAVLDHTDYRHAFGAWTAYAMVIIKVIELALSQTTWLLVASLQVLSTILYLLHTVVVYAYTSALTQDPVGQSGLQTRFFSSMYIGMLLYMILVLVPVNLFDFGASEVENDKGDGDSLVIVDPADFVTAQWAVFVTAIFAGPLFVLSWEFLFDRNWAPVSKLPPSQSLWTVGFHKLYQAYHTISVEQPSIRTFLIAIAFSESADTALFTIATTYMTEVLKLQSSDIGIVILTALVTGVPGTLLGNWFTAKYENPIWSAQVSLVLYSATTLAGALLLTEERAHLSYLFGGLWGICQGWMHPQHTTIFVTMTPPGSMGWMGVFLFACQILAFLPPAVFSILNEAGLSMRLGLASLTIYFVVGLIGLELVRRGSNNRHTIHQTSQTHAVC